MARILALHLLPGIFIVTFYLLTAPVLTSLGFPRVAALLLGFLVVGIPIQVGILRRNGPIEFREPMPRWLFALLFAGLFALAIGMLVVLPFSPISEYLATRVFSWAPAAILPAPDQTPASKSVLVLITLVLQLLIDGLNPIVEEFYFRGLLLPRLRRFGWMAPVINTALFTLAHFWQPYNYVSIFANVLPLTVVTWWRRNIYVQMALHCTANTIGAALALYAFFH